MIVRDTHAAEDIFQNVVIKAMTKEVRVESNINLGQESHQINSIHLPSSTTKMNKPTPNARGTFALYRNPHPDKVAWLSGVLLILRAIMSHDVIIDPDVVARFKLEFRCELR